MLPASPEQILTQVYSLDMHATRHVPYSHHACWHAALFTEKSCTKKPSEMTVFMSCTQTDSLTDFSCRS